MKDEFKNGRLFSSFILHPSSLRGFVLSVRTRWIVCWLVALGAGAFHAEQAWTGFDQSDRADGNYGHATIDFGGQWLMGRMIVEGHGRHLYDRNYLRGVAHEHYPTADGDPNAETEDAEALMTWVVGYDRPEAPPVLGSFVAPLAAGNALDETILLAYAETTWTPKQLTYVTDPSIGGALYPPVHALLYAPLALMPPRVAYRLLQAVVLAMTFFAGWVVHRMTQGRVWWPIATVFLMMFPGYSGCIQLAQNGVFTLVILLLGWWQLLRGREVLAGACWGLMAFKPVWAVAFFLVPLLTTRWRMAASMAVTGLVQIALTLPVVGWPSWHDWFQVGQMAAEDYKRQENWIFLSRDLVGIPRRWLLVYEKSVAKRLVWESEENAAEHPEDHLLPAVLGWALWGLVLGLTLFVVWRRRQQRKALTGPPAAFVLTGALYTCFHFLYYDYILMGLPFVLLFTEPSRYFQVAFWRLPRWLRRGKQTEKMEVNPLPEVMQRYYEPSLDLPPPLPLLPDGRRPRWVRAQLPPFLLLIVLAVPAYCCLRDHSYHFPPFDTFTALFLWAWCGYRMMVSRDAERSDDTKSVFKSA